MIKKTDKGSMMPYTIVIILVCIMLMAGLWEYLRIYSVLIQIDQSITTAVEGVAQENWDNIYQGVREGYAGGYTKNDLTDNWKEILNRKQITAQLKEMIELKEEGLLLSKVDDKGELIYSIKPNAMEIKITNTTLNDQEGHSLKVEAINEIELPFMFLAGMFENVPPITFSHTTYCEYVPKF